MEGTSLAPAFRGHEITREAIYWEHEGNLAVRRGDMKLVSKDKQKWELYNFARDRSEQDDLASSQRHLVAESRGCGTRMPNEPCAAADSVSQ